MSKRWLQFLVAAAVAAAIVSLNLLVRLPHTTSPLGRTPPAESPAPSGALAAVLPAPVTPVVTPAGLRGLGDLAFVSQGLL